MGPGPNVPPAPRRRLHAWHSEPWLSVEPLARPPPGKPDEQCQGCDDKGKEAHEALRPGVAKRVCRMSKRREEHEEEAQPKPQCRAAHHENDGIASREAASVAFLIDCADECPRCQRGDAECQEDSNRQ
jgi:hypothetical protein